MGAHFVDWFDCFEGSITAPRACRRLVAALIFLVVSLVAALFGFTGISAASVDIARVLFFIFLVIFVVLLILGLMAGRRV
jgi:uncharacterized membrane protein YtjA (UPF0391 family)